MTPTISKEKFLEIMKKLRVANDLYDDWHKLCFKAQQEVKEDWFIDGFMINHESIVIDLLNMILCPEEKDSTLCYYIYDLNFGREYFPGCIEEADGTPIVIDTDEHLYEYLTRSKGNGNEKKEDD